MKYFREGTWDKNIAACVIEHNEYNVPKDLSGMTVMDVGAHIGSFSWLCANRNAAKVVAFEALPANHALAVKNLDGLAATVVNAAVWRSDVPPVVLHFAECLEPVNTGGGNVFSYGGNRPVLGIPFDSIVDQLGRVHLLKLDCEGSEFPILFTSQKLAQVDCIVGEFHEFAPGTIPEIARVEGRPEFTVAALREFLMGLGFAFYFKRAVGHPLGHFRATKA